ncbi:MAG: serine/threonine protein kinase, partial [Nitrospinota bacterium]|nr:serine/threonine protein kinase [Nitrospinota bacterium]
RQGELAAKVRILLKKSSSQARKLDDTTVEGFDATDRDTNMMRFKETGQILSKDFAGFTIIDKLGQGGTATVYRAMEPIHLKPVALKVISPFAAVKEGFIKRLRRSNEISIKLVHPHIVRTYTLGEYQGVHFMVQELVEGSPLDTFLHEDEDEHKPQPLDESLGRRYMRQISMALEYLENQNLIHRDVKPGNVYVNRDGEAKLGDFGLSRLVDDVGQTVEGYLLGTPHYISPEQANGSKDLDIRSDLYSLGASFYHLLAGEPMFEGTNLQQVVLAHLTKDAHPLKERAASVSDAMCAIVDRLVRRERDERFQTAVELNEALDALPALPRSRSSAVD